jgi:hypothetical protein
MEKISQKDTYLGSLKRPLAILIFLPASYEKQVNLCYDYGLGKNPTFENIL